jgi:type IV pilus assembly protein PilQ
LDRRTPQVLIEARIVTLESNFRKELGINWSGQFNADPAHGNALDYRFPYTINTPFQVNLPNVFPSIGSIGPIRLGSIDDILSVNVRIDAAEEEKKAKTLSQPKIFTQDNVAATVDSTRTVYVSVGGDAVTPATIQAIPATLSLSVTPRISSDGYITMVVAVSNGVVTPPIAGITPTTNIQTVNSTVTVKDSETIVIGGIFSTDEQKNFTAVPFLHKIPVIGWLFKSTNPNQSGQSELLVFLTPRVLDRSLLKAEESSNVSLSY